MQVKKHVQNAANRKRGAYRLVVLVLVVIVIVVEVVGVAVIVDVDAYEAMATETGA